MLNSMGLDFKCPLETDLARLSGGHGGIFSLERIYSSSSSSVINREEILAIHSDHAIDNFFDDYEKLRRPALMEHYSFLFTSFNFLQRCKILESEAGHLSDWQPTSAAGVSRSIFPQARNTSQLIFVIRAKSFSAAALQRLGLPAAITIAGVIEGKEDAIWLPKA
ncbi:hypothetical protein BDR07DRAFT_1467266 [Suillus spraguei]|nr:hypothetical protein BDR07DRAFT_1467266 [Suillus spraguei]